MNRKELLPKYFATGTPGMYLAYNGSGNLVETAIPATTKSITIETPTATENIAMFFTTVAMTVSQVNDVVKGSSSPSVTWNIKFAAARDSGSPTALFAVDRGTTSTSGASTTGFANATIPANSWVWLTSSATTGIPTGLSVTLKF